MGGRLDNGQQPKSDTEGAVHEAHDPSLASHQRAFAHLRLFFMQPAPFFSTIS
jgi:hypothetical protein